MKRVSFSWDFVTASALVLVLLSAFFIILPLATSDLKSDAGFSQKQRSALFKADFLLKSCFPDGIAFCENSFLYSHVADSRANLTFGNGGFCVKRLVLQDGKEKIMVVCE